MRCVILLVVGARRVVVLDAADVLPVAVGAEAEHALLGVLHRQHQVGHVEAAALRDVREAAPVEHVDAHADRVVDLGLLVVVRELRVGQRGDDAVVDAHRALRHRDRAERLLLPVEREQLAVVERRQHVAVHHQEVVVEVGDRAQRAGGALRLVLEHVVDAHAPARAVADHRREQARHVAERDDDAVTTGCAQLREHDFEDRLVAERQQGLRHRDRQRREPRAPAAGQDHRHHGRAA
jgi:hypothetical protein